MLEGFHAQLQEQLSTLEFHGLRRSLRVIESSQGTLIRIEGRDLVNFSSNDYLGLASHPALAEAMAEAARLPVQRLLPRFFAAAALFQRLAPPSEEWHLLVEQLHELKHEM